MQWERNLFYSHVQSERCKNEPVMAHGEKCDNFARLFLFKVKQVLECREYVSEFMILLHVSLNL